MTGLRQKVQNGAEEAYDLTSSKFIPPKKNGLMLAKNSQPSAVHQLADDRDGLVLCFNEHIRPRAAA